MRPFDERAEVLDDADVERRVVCRDEQPAGDGVIIMACRRHLVKIIGREGIDKLVAPLTHIFEPSEDRIDRPYRAAQIFNRYPFRAEDLERGGYKFTLVPLEELANMYPLPVGDMPHMPEDAQRFWVGHPEEMLIGKSVYLAERVCIPEPPAVQKMC